MSDNFFVHRISEPDFPDIFVSTLTAEPPQVVYNYPSVWDRDNLPYSTYCMARRRAVRFLKEPEIKGCADTSDSTLPVLTDHHEYYGFSRLSERMGCLHVFTKYEDNSLRDECNYDQIVHELDLVDPDMNFHSITSHGSVRFITVDPDAPADIVELAESLHHTVTEYGLIDDCAYYEALGFAAELFWRQMTLKERVDVCKKDGESIFMARHYDLPEVLYDAMRIAVESEGY